VQIQVKPRRLLALEASDGCLGQVQFAVINQFVLRAEFHGQAEIEGVNNDLLVAARNKGTVNVAIDRGGQNTAAFLLVNGGTSVPPPAKLMRKVALARMSMAVNLAPWWFQGS
jgi:hypothetical protein